MIKTYAARAYGLLAGAAGWVWDNKPFFAAAVIGVTATMQASGYRNPALALRA